jgi:putative hemolysin
VIHIAAFLAVLVLYYLSYVFAVAAGGLYLSDHDEKRFVDSLPEKKKAAARVLLDNPKQLAVTATLIQSGSLIVSTILWFLIGSGFVLPNVQKYAIEIALIVIGWFVYTTLVAVIAPNLKQERALDIIESKTWLLRSFMTISSPAVSSIIKFKSSLVDQQDLDERKEEIVERAIEELADSAGIDEPAMAPNVRDMIVNVFDLADSEVREVMVPRIEIKFLEQGASFRQVQELVAETGYSRIPVCESGIDNIIGILHVKDLFKLSPLPEAESAVTGVLRPALFVPESKQLSKLLEEFKLQKVHMAIVVDEYGGTSGLVTMEDLLELIVGDIQDEHDSEEADVVKVSDTEYVVSANLSMYDLSDQLDLKLQEKEFETVGGYIYDLVGSLPDVGQKVAADGIAFVVERVHGQRIEKVRVILPAAREQQA